MPDSRLLHAPGRREGPGGGIVQFGGAHRKLGAFRVFPSNDQDSSILKKRGSLEQARGGHIPCRCKGATCRIVQFGTGQSTCSTGRPARNQNPAVRKRYGRVACTADTHST